MNKRNATKPRKKTKVADESKAVTAICPYCTQIFTSVIGNYKRHLLKMHGVDEINKKVECLEDKCNEKFVNISNLRNHLTKDHSFNMESVTLHFDTITDFNDWKARQEKEDNIIWVKQTGQKHLGNKQEVIYYYCKRNGARRIKYERKRQLKAQGSCKLNAYCTSAIILEKQNDKYKVVFYRNHYGHLNNINFDTKPLKRKNETNIKDTIQNKLDHICANIKEVNDEETLIEASKKLKDVLTFLKIQKISHKKTEVNIEPSIKNIKKQTKFYLIKRKSKKSLIGQANKQEDIEITELLLDTSENTVDGENNPY